jgi:hypothetical protein
MTTNRWTYKTPAGQCIPAAREVRELQDEVKVFLHECTGSELMREIRSMLDDNPPEIVDAITMLDYLCALHKPTPAPEISSLIARSYINRVVTVLTDRKLSGAALLIEQLADAAGVPK